MQSVLSWVRRREHPVADQLYRTAKRLRKIDLPVIPGFHPVLRILHLATTQTLREAARVLYWTPLFRSRLQGSHRRLHIAGFGMPLVCGPVDIIVGDDCRFSNAVTISGRCTSPIRPKLLIGNNVGIGWQTTISVGSQIEFGDNVRIAGRAYFSGYPGHPLDATARAAGEPDTDDQVGEIILHSDVWLGTGCIILPGVEIGSGTVVAAGSVVTKSLPPGVIAAGMPAKVIRRLDGNSDRAYAKNVIELEAEG